MRAHILCTTTGRTIYANSEVSQDDKKKWRQEWKSDEGAYLGPVGNLPDCYKIINIVDEKRKE